MTLRLGSLFSGIGGLELGLEQAGMETVWQVEKSEYCRRILEKHWPDAQRFDDVQNVGKHNLPPVDVICGGFPCQDISYAGKGAGLSGKRSGLWYEFARVISEMEPRYVVVENVPALLTRGIDQVLGTLADLGYDAEWRTISAAELGAPHLRRRIFILAYANGAGILRPREDRPLSRNGQSPDGEERLQESEGAAAGGNSGGLGNADGGRRQQRDPRLGEDGVTGEGHPPLGDPSSNAGRGNRGGIRGSKAEGGSQGSPNGHRADRPRNASNQVGNPESRGRGEGPEQPARRTDGGRPELGHPDRAGLIEQRRPEPVRPEQRPPERRGREIHRWEDATPCTGADGTIRLIPKEAAETGSQSPLWPVADGLPGRVARLSAIGNAVVPAAAAVVGQRIREMEGR